MTVFHLLRHGEPTVFGRINGRLPGVGLSAQGRAEIAAQAGRLAGENIEAIYAARCSARARPPRSSLIG